MFISVTVKLKLDFSFTNKLEKYYLYKIVTPTAIDSLTAVNSSNTFLRGDKSHNNVRQLICVILKSDTTL